MARKTADNWRRFLIASVAVMMILWPFYLIVLYSMMDEADILRWPPSVLPRSVAVEPYAEAARLVWSHLINSSVIALGVTVVSMAGAAPAAFALTQLRLRAIGWVWFLMAFAQMAPMVAVVTPLFLVFFKVGLLNSHWSVILAVSAFAMPFATLVLGGYMRTIPRDLIEVAYIDGASPFRVFWHIVLPVVKPAVVTAALLVFLQGWGNFVFPVAFIQTRELQPMSVALFYFVGQFGVRWNVLFAVSAIFALPPVVAVLIAGRGLVAGLTAGALRE